MQSPLIIKDQAHLKIFADYFQFYIQDEDVTGDLSEKWSKEAVDRLLAVTDGTIGIGTIRNMDVPVTVKIFDFEPAKLEDEDGTIRQINECDLVVKSGKIVIAGCTDYFPEAKRLVLTNGIYRARLYYGNLDKLSEDGLDGDDFYEVHLWPSNKEEGVKILKLRPVSR